MLEGCEVVMDFALKIETATEMKCVSKHPTTMTINIETHLQREIISQGNQERMIEFVPFISIF